MANAMYICCLIFILPIIVEDNEVPCFFDEWLSSLLRELLVLLRKRCFHFLKDSFLVFTVTLSLHVTTCERESLSNGQPNKKTTYFGSVIWATTFVLCNIPSYLTNFSLQ